MKGDAFLLVAPQGSSPADVVVQIHLHQTKQSYHRTTYSCNLLAATVVLVVVGVVGVVALNNYTYNC